MADNPYLWWHFGKCEKTDIDINMEKKLLYTAPAVRELVVNFDASFLQSATTGPIQDWGEDDDPINF